MGPAKQWFVWIISAQMLLCWWDCLLLKVLPSMLNCFARSAVIERKQLKQVSNLVSSCWTTTSVRRNVIIALRTPPISHSGVEAQAGHSQPAWPIVMTIVVEYICTKSTKLGKAEWKDYFTCEYREHNVVFLVSGGCFPVHQSLLNIWLIQLLFREHKDRKCCLRWSY